MSSPGLYDGRVMPTNTDSGTGRDALPPRTGHGAASVIPRLNEQISRPEVPALEDAAEEARTREAPRSEAPPAEIPGRPSP